MWNPVRDEEKEAATIIKRQAIKGIKKELEKIEKRVKVKSEKLMYMGDTNASTKRRAIARTNLSLECQERDRYKLALDILGKSL